jgi:tetratricopeptide (TPR) repeat protein
MRYVNTLVMCLLSLGLLPLSFAQVSVDTLRQNINDRLYTAVVQISAPDLLEREPNNPEAHFLFAYALYYTGDPTQARLELDKALALDIKPSPEVEHLDGLLKASEGDKETALDLLKNAAMQSEDYTMAMEWGRVAWESNFPQEALTAFAQAAKTSEGQKKMWPELNRGRILHLVLNDYDAAIEAYNLAINIFEDNDPGGPPPPGYVEAQFRLGQSYEAKDDIPTARTYYEIAQRLDATYEPAIAALERLGN